MAKFRCKICGRNKFQEPTPHICCGQYLKHYGRKAYKERYNGSIWEEINEEK